jgi:hypothetical protein
MVVIVKMVKIVVMVQKLQRIRVKAQGAGLRV